MVLAEYSEKQDGFKEKPLGRVRRTRLGLGAQEAQEQIGEQVSLQLTVHLRLTLRGQLSL